jgi:NADH-quinone oxidoreductase subunit H
MAEFRMPSLGADMEAGTLVEWLKLLWFILIQPLGLLIYYICGLAETNRSPFDLPEAESELVAGYLTEFSGLRWAMFFLGEYGNMCIVSAVAAVVFLGGWSGPGANEGFWVGLLGGFFGQVIFNAIAAFWFIAKMAIFLFAFLMVRVTLPRLRADQLMRFAWLGLIPLTLFNILLTGALLLIPTDTNVKLIVAGVANWLLLFIFVFGFRRLTGVGKKLKQAREGIPAVPGVERLSAKEAKQLTGAGTP